MPRAKIETYLYNSEGKFIRIVESFSEIYNLYYNGYKYPLFTNDIDKSIHELPDGNILSKNRYGRESIRKYFIRKNDPFINPNKYKAKGKVIVKNRDGEIIAIFINIRIAEIMLGKSRKTLWSKMNENKNIKANDNLFMEFCEEK